MFHHFSHSSIKGFVICKSQWNSLCLCPFSFWLVTSVRLRFKWFVQSTLHQEISHCHVSKCFAWCVALLVMRVKSLLCVLFWARPDIGWKGGAGIKISFKRLPQFDREDFDERLGMFSGMPLFLSHVHFDSSYLTSHLLSDTASVEQAALSSEYVPFMCCFAWFVC